MMNRRSSNNKYQQDLFSHQFPAKIKEESLGRINRDTGIERAQEHADHDEVGWNETAFEFLKKFLGIHRGSFMGEDVRMYAEGMGLKIPPSKRAWGGIIRKAVKEGLIMRIGYGQVRNPQANRANAAVWINNKK